MRVMPNQGKLAGRRLGRRPIHNCRHDSRTDKLAAGANAEFRRWAQLESPAQEIAGDVIRSIGRLMSGDKRLGFLEQADGLQMLVPGPVSPSG